MHGLILSATYNKKTNTEGVEVPAPLLELEKAGEPWLVALIEKLNIISPRIDHIHVVTNDMLYQQLDELLKEHASKWPNTQVTVVNDQMQFPEKRGAVGDILFCIEEQSLEDEDLLIIGGDNWFNFNLQEFVDAAKNNNPTVLMTPLSGQGYRLSRFGLGSCDEDGKLTEFIEKPNKTNLNLKASCVYYFNSSQVRYFSEFTQNNDPKSSPGQLLEWLVAKHDVYSVVFESGTWFDFDDSALPNERSNKGPDQHVIIDILNQYFHPKYATWEKSAFYKVHSATSYQNLLELVEMGDTNTRLVATAVLGNLGSRNLLSPEGQSEVISHLLPLLNEKIANEISYSGSQYDEENPVYLSDVAAKALKMLGYQ